MNSHMRLLPSLLLGCLLIASLAASGCGGGVGNVSGKVSFNGQPIPAGRITFFGSDGRPATGVIEKDGTYTVLSVSAGHATIVVDSKPPTPVYGKWGSGTKVLGQKDESTKPGPHIPIPARYSSAQTSGLELTVSRGDQTHDIVLEP